MKRMMVIVFCSLLFSSCDLFQSTHDISYIIVGTVNPSAVSYFDENGNNVTINNPILPWSKLNFRSPQAIASVQMKVTSTPETALATLSIYVDNILQAKSTLYGEIFTAEDETWIAGHLNMTTVVSALCVP